MSRLNPWNRLLEKSKTIKDPVHGDIDFTSTEIRIIDTPQFQRLRFIRQLGPAHEVYPSAQHSRFEHMLGTMHIAQRIVDMVNRNAELGDKIGAKDTFIIRLVALLHDFANLPFGHTLEDEGRLFPKKQWQNEVRQETLFGPVAAIIKSCIETAFSELSQHEEGVTQGKSVNEIILQCLIAEEGGEVEELESPFIADIVGNTICADLLDYLKRDVYFTGLSGQYDERVLSYFTLMSVTNAKKVQKMRLVIKLFKSRPGKAALNPRRDEIRHDVLSGLLDMLRLRYSLAEKVYYHHAKREASAIAIKMVAEAMKAHILDEKKLCGLTDDSLVYHVREFEYRKDADRLTADERAHLDIAKKLSHRLEDRDLYKPVYEVKIHEIANEKKIRELIEGWEQRLDFEATLSNQASIGPEDLIIYIPRNEMGAKAAKVLVQLPLDAAQGCCQLDALPSKSLPVEYADEKDVIEAELGALDKRHRMLWKMSVLIHASVDDGKKLLVKKLCEEYFESDLQLTLVDIKSEKLGQTLSIGEKLEIARTATQTLSTPSPQSEKQSGFLRLSLAIDSLLGSKK